MSYPNSKTVHTFCIPSSCTGTNRLNLGTNDPGTLKNIFNILMDGRRDNAGPAFKATHYNEENDSFDTPIPPEIICDTECLPVIPVVDGDNLCVNGSIFPVMSTLAANIALQPTLEAKLLRTLFLYSEPSRVYGNPNVPNCSGTTGGYTDDQYEVVIIYDDKIPIPIGKLIDGGANDLIKEFAPLVFPLSFNSFHVTVHSLVTDVYYSIFRFDA